MFIALYILGAVCNALPGIIYLGQYTMNSIQHGWYYILQSVSYLFIIYGTKFYNKNDIVHKELLKSVWWLAFSNVIDELFFNPLKLGYNELFFALIIMALFIYRLWKVYHKKMS